LASRARPLLDWQEARIKDDLGLNAVSEICFVAHDAEGLEWIVAPHDDGTWNWTRWDAGTPISMGVGQDAAEALAAANAHAVNVLKG
jgi:hypothetical protein